MNILAMGSHPDDIESWCAGTLAKYRALGHNVFMASSTNGNIGHPTMSKEEIAAVRLKEARNSAAIIGAEYICLDYDDEMFFEDPEKTRLEFINLVRYCKAGVILTHYPEDYNPDHELTGKIINDIAVMIPIPKLRTQSAPYDVVPSIFYYEPANCYRFIPTDYVDITDYFETKIKMMNCMESQKVWMAANFSSMDYKEEKFVDNLRIIAEFRGMQAQCKYAEGFIRALDGMRTRMTERVLP